VEPQGQETVVNLGAKDRQRLRESNGMAGADKVDESLGASPDLERPRNLIAGLFEWIAHGCSWVIYYLDLAPRSE
jgi:hypothetical protein